MQIPKITLKRAIGLGVLLVVLVVIGRGIILSQKNIPTEFSDARVKGGKIAEEIVAQSNYSAEILDQIAKLDRDGRYAEALNIVSDEIYKYREANQKANTLSAQLVAMAQSIGGIKPYLGRELATAAVSSEVALVGRLINYNNYLATLFGILQKKFESGGWNSNGQVKELIRQINEEVRIINELNHQFNDSLAKFDNLFETK